MTITQLAELHRAITEYAGNGDMPALYACEREILRAPIRTDADRVAVLNILLASGDKPGFPEIFQNEIFERLRAASGEQR